MPLSSKEANRSPFSRLRDSNPTVDARPARVLWPRVLDPGHVYVFVFGKIMRLLITEGGKLMDPKLASRPASSIQVVNPFMCRIWNGHSRMTELLTERSCREEISSFLQHGQKHPVLGRPIRGDAQHQFELIYGARRLFVAQYLNMGLLVESRDVSDREAFIEMDIENRLRRDISPYERGIAFREWLRLGHFESQKDLAAALGISAAQVSRLLKFAELPAIVVRAFSDQADIRESWAVMLAERCKDPEVRLRITAMARSLAASEAERYPEETLKLLLDCGEKKPRSRNSCGEQVFRSASGEALFRISYRDKEFRIVVPRARAPSATVERLSQALRQLIELNHVAQPSPPCVPLRLPALLVERQIDFPRLV
jgi:ParB/RepB/Spo0J family partition protein